MAAARQLVNCKGCMLKQGELALLQLEAQAAPIARIGHGVTAHNEFQMLEGPWSYITCTYMEQYQKESIP